MSDALSVLAVVLAGVALLVVARRAGRQTPADTVADRERAKDVEIASLRATVLTLTEALSAAEARIAELEAPRAKGKRGASAPESGPPTLLVGVGPDKALLVDLPALRSTSLRFLRLMDVSRDALATHLQRRRGAGDGYRYVHLAVHGGAQGLQFADDVADGLWLSVHLRGVEVVFLASCEGSDLGDQLGAVPFVVTLSERVQHRDAADATKIFWSLIGEGMAPEQAFYTMCDRCPAVAEFAVIHS